MSDEILSMLKSSKTEDRIKAVNRMRRLGGEERQSLLLLALQDKSNFVAAMAAEQLGNEADWGAMSEMLKRFLWLSGEGLKRDPGCHIRAHLAFAFGRLEYHAASDAIKIGIRTIQIEAVGGVPFDTGAHLRANCALALAQLNDRDAVFEIAPLLFDDGSNGVAPLPAKLQGVSLVRASTRIKAAEALGRTGNQAALVALAIKLRFPGEEEAQVLQECMQATVDLGSEHSLSLLAPYLTHFDPGIAAYACLMLARTRKPEVPELILRCIERLDGDSLQAAILALASLNDEASRKFLYRLAEDPRKEVRQSLLEALRESEIPGDIAFLKSLI